MLVNPSTAARESKYSTHGLPATSENGPRPAGRDPTRKLEIFSGHQKRIEEQLYKKKIRLLSLKLLSAQRKKTILGVATIPPCAGEGE